MEIGTFSWLHAQMIMSEIRTPIPEDVWNILLNWTTVGQTQLRKAKAYLYGRTDVLFDVKHYGDIEEGTAHVVCTVLEDAKHKGNMYRLGSIFVDRKGHDFVAYPPE